MTRDPRYDVLFEPVAIGPVTAPNRFYQVPHCTGMGYDYPRTLNRLREINAEGGWGVVCTEFCSIHPSALSNRQCTLWDEDDVAMLADMVERVHRHGALAGVQLWYGGYSNYNTLTRELPLGPHSVPVWHGPGQTQAMTRADVRRLRHWHREAALRAKRAGFDVVYVYAAHGYLPAQFLSPVLNQRTDEYGGSFENRARLIRELLEETKDAVGDACAVAFRFSVDNLDAALGITHEGEGRDLVELVAEEPDLWDVNVANFQSDALPSRFAGEAAQEPYVRFVKRVTSKPVVGVGRFTSPDTMLGQINRGVLDFIGAARPSIADPFLPRKIEEGRPEDVRECIGCNLCIWSNHKGFPLRCTQNPTRGEEWRRGWHPEEIAARHADESVLVVGAGPAGLEAALSLGRRGYRVVLAEARTELGGRVTLESALPGLSEWARVRDHRIHALRQMPNVEIYRDSRLDAEQVLEFGFAHVCIATGSRWRRDGAGRTNAAPFPGWRSDEVVGPEEVFRGAGFEWNKTAPGHLRHRPELPQSRAPESPGNRDDGCLPERPPLEGPCVVFDDDHFYMACVIAEKAREAGREVTLVTTANEVASEGHGSLEQHPSQARVLELGIELLCGHRVSAFEPGAVTLACVYTGRERRLPCQTLIPVTSREPEEALYLSLTADEDRLRESGIVSLERIGDCAAPGLIAAAVFAGHRYARELGGNAAVPARDRIVVGGAAREGIRKR